MTSRDYYDIAFTSAVRHAQVPYGSRAAQDASTTSPTRTTAPPSTLHTSGLLRRGNRQYFSRAGS